MRIRSRQSRRAAFTLVELLAASFLAALLTLVVLHTVATLARSQPRAVSNVSAPIVEVIGHDFANARSVRFSQNTFILTGYFDSPNRAQIVYSLRPIAGRTWLTRQESQFDTLIAKSQTELVAPDVAAFSISPAAPTTRPTDMPTQARLLIRFSNPATQSIETTLHR